MLSGLSSFSILKRIEGIATSFSVTKATSEVTSFSILKRIEGIATRDLFILVLSILSTFSILKRIEGIATGIGGCGVCGRLAFQYPQADRGDCNLVLLHDMLRPALTFSILKRIEGIATMFIGRPPLPRRLSVSSSGSRGLQHQAPG